MATSYRGTQSSALPIALSYINSKAARFEQNPDVNLSQQTA